MVCGTLDQCFIMAHSIHNLGDYEFTLVWYLATEGTTHRSIPARHHIWRIYTLCPFSGHENTDGSGVGWMILLASVCYCDCRVGKHFFILSLVLAITVSLMASSSSFFFSLPSPPGQCSRHLQWSALFTLLCITWHSCSNPLLLRCESLLQWQQNRSKAMMYKIPAIWGCPRHF